MFGEVEHGDQVEDHGDHHQDQDGDVKKKDFFMTNILNEAGEDPNIWLDRWAIREKNIQAKNKEREGSSQTPGKDGEDDKLGDLRSTLVTPGVAEGPTEIQTENSHPAKHGDADKVTKVAKEDAEERSLWRNIIDNDDVEGDKEDTGDIADNYLAVEVEKVRDRNIHNEGYDQGEKTDQTKYGEEDVIVHVLHVTHLLFLALKYHEVPDTLLDTDLHTVSHGVSISMMVQLPLPHHCEALPWLQQVEGAAVGHGPCLVQGQEVWGKGFGHWEGQVTQQLRQDILLE